MAGICRSRYVCFFCSNLSIFVEVEKLRSFSLRSRDETLESDSDASAVGVHDLESVVQEPIKATPPAPTRAQARAQAAILIRRTVAAAAASGCSPLEEIFLLKLHCSTLSKRGERNDGKKSWGFMLTGKLFFFCVCFRLLRIYFPRSFVVEFDCVAILELSRL